MRRILSIAAAEGNGVMILGAFGCGALRNPPEIVAEAMRTIVQEYRSHFQTIKCEVWRYIARRTMRFRVPGPAFSL